MTPDAFIARWSGATLSERAAAQSHFIDLCRLLGEPTPAEADPHGEFYCFERGATKTTGGKGWADVWKRGFFGWEYKGKRRDLDAACAPAATAPKRWRTSSYGWPAGIAEDEALAALLALSRERGGAEPVSSRPRAAPAGLPVRDSPRRPPPDAAPRSGFHGRASPTWASAARRALAFRRAIRHGCRRPPPNRGE